MIKRIDTEKFFSNVSRYLFTIYLLFVFFGTELPFQPPVTEVGEKGGSNIVNQAVFSSLFLATLIPLWMRRHDAINLLKCEKWLTLFILWCLISFVWSDFPFVSFKRSIQILITFAICLNALLWVRSSYELISSFKKVLYLYLILSILSVLLVSGAIDPQTMAWRALAPSKNHLGQAALISAIIFYISMAYEGSKSNLLDGFMLALSLVLLMGSESMTSIMTLFFLILLSVFLHINKRFKQLGLNQFFTIYAFMGTLAFALILVQFSTVLNSFMDLIGKEATFTGRTELWAAVFHETRRHLLLGSGFGGFWVVHNPAVLGIYRDFVWLPNQSHIGYLDILNETGLVGILLFLGMVLAYFRKQLSLTLVHPWFWCLLAALIINFQESTLFRQNVLTGVVFLFSYLGLHRDLHSRQDNFREYPSKSSYIREMPELIGE